jgi:Concanavalin A-like lectin/glucanases superfamily/Calcineurin-like phosphoesterase
MLGRGRLSAVGAMLLSLLASACGAAEDSSPSPQDINPRKDREDAGASSPSPPSAACAGKPVVEASSLVLDGVDDHVTMGTAKALGLDRFTVEAWVRRDGAGVPFSTGVGGLSLVPIAGKGRGEGDGSNVDCNYAFGFSGDVLGADFEDAASGANHPVLGTTKIPLGEWHHVAMTYDGTKWQLFVDGHLDGEATANATPRKDSIQHFAIGSAIDSKGTPAGFLKGAIDEVRVWDRARSEAEIGATVYKRLGSEPGLVARWALDQKDNGAPDSVGQTPGTIVGGATFVATGAILESGLPPKISSELPATGADVTGTSAELGVKLDDPDSTGFTATFHVRQIVDGDDFTVVVMPDTQYYTRPGDNPNYFYDQTKWIMDNAEGYNIVGVIHNGDIVDNGNTDSQWAIATKAMATLEKTSTRFPEGMPYGTSAGNHDQSPNGELNGTTKYNIHFGTSRFAKKSWFGGTYASGKIDENWFTFNAGGLEFVVVNLQYGEVAREAPVLSWTRGVFQQHPDAFGIVNSHYILTGAGNFSAAGKSIYEAVKDVPNVQVLTCGHVGAEKARTDTFEGHPVHSMLADYQFRDKGGAGYFRIWEFSPKNDELTVRTYSPTEKKFETDADSEFTLKVDLAGAGKSAFKPLAIVDPADASGVKATLDGLAPGQTYEWYVDVTDCAHTVTSPRYRFKTK